MNCKRKSKLRKNVATLESPKPWTMGGRKPRIHDDYGVLENVAWIWRWLGVFPLTIKYSMGVKGYSINKFCVVYTVFITSACLATFILAMIKMDEWIGDRISIEHITMFIRTVASLMCLFLNGIWRIIRHKELTGLIETMIAQDLILERLGCPLKYESIARIVQTYIWMSILIVSTFVAYDFYATAEAYSSVPIQWILWILPSITQVIDLTILVSLVGLLGYKFRALNKKIKSIALRANAISPMVIVTSDVCANNLQLVAKGHYNICAVGKRLNRFFSWDVLINVVTAFIILSTTLYYIFDEVQQAGDTNYVRIGTYVHWECIHSIPIIVIVVVCNWTTKQGVHTGKLIHEIRVTKADTRLYEAVKTFSLQMHHQKLEFTAGGFFPIDSTLLQTMVGNITTYLVILIQFQPKLE